MKKMVFVAMVALAGVAFAAGPGGGGMPGGDMGGGMPGGDMGGGMPGGGMGGGGMPGGGMGGALSFDDVISVTTNADSTLSRDSLVYGYASSPTSVKAGSGVSEIADGCFAGCTTLTTVNLSSSKMTSVPSDCFAGCTSLKSVVLPSCCKTVGANAFAGCTSLVSVTGGSVSSVGADAFRDCLALTSAPTNAASIGVCAFANCPKLGTVESTSTEIDEDTDDDDTTTGGDTGDDDTTGGDTDDDTTTGGDTTDGGEVAEGHSLFESDAAPLTASYATVYDGIVMDGDETIGSVKLKVGKANKRTKIARFAAIANILGRKKTTYSGKALVDGTGAVAITLEKDGTTMALTVAGEAFSGEIDGFEIVGVRNVSASKETRSSEYAAWAGTYDIVLATTNATGTGAAFAGGYSTLAVKVLSKGKASVKGVMADGTKFSASGLPLLLSADGSEACVDVVVPLYKGKLGGFGFQLWLGADGSLDVTGISAWDASVSTTAQFMADLEFADAGKLAAPADGAYSFALDTEEFPATLNGLAVATDLLPSAISVTATSGKLKAATGNSAKLALSRNASTGLVTGRFAVFTQNGSRLKRTAAKLYGVAGSSGGCGTAVVKGVGSFAFTLR